MRVFNEENVFSFNWRSVFVQFFGFSRLSHARYIINLHTQGSAQVGLARGKKFKKVYVHDVP
jgi:hypothetical protein